jgi:hypothetical protein
MRLRLLVLALIFLVIPTVFAAESQIEIQANPVDNVVDWNGTAVYNLVVRNMMATGDYLRLRPATFEWGQMAFDEQIVLVPANGHEQVMAHLTPPRDVRIGSYAVEIVAISQEDPTIRGSTFLKLIVTSELPKVEPDWGGIPVNLEPGETPVSLILKNAGSTGISDISATLDSGLLPKPVLFDVGDLAKGEAKLVWNENLKLPLNMNVGNYDFSLSIYQSGNLVNRYVHNVEVLPKASVDVQVSEESGFLSKTFTASITNIGNTLAQDSYSADLPSWQRVFLQSKSDYDLVTGAVAGTVSAEWPYSLQQGQNATVIYRVSFVPILGLMLALLVIFYSLSWYLRQDLHISKELIGENKALKIQIIVKNDSQKPRHNVIVEDILHSPLKLTREFATAQPKAIRKIGGSVRILWKFDTVWPGEEKVLAYGIKSALPLVGSVILPSAKIRTRMEGNRQKVYLSNQVSVPAWIQVIEDEPKPSE